MSDTPSAELHIEPAHRREGIAGGGGDTGWVLSEELRWEFGGGWVDSGQLYWINQFFFCCFLGLWFV